jgi:FG-GAP repeat
MSKRRTGSGGAALVALGIAWVLGGCVRLQKGHMSSSARFGRSVAMLSETAAVGAFEENGTVNEQGAVYVYDLLTGIESLQARIVAPDPASAHFGAAVALADGGDTLVVGAPFADYAGVSQAGAVYVFLRSNGTWALQGKLGPLLPQGGQAFGASVAIDGNLLVVGSPSVGQSPPTGTVRNPSGGGGAAYVFQRIGLAFGAPVALSRPSPAASDQFGVSVAIAGSTVLVGATGRTLGAAQSTGAVFAYTRSGFTWALGQTLVASDAQALDLFGGSLATSGSGNTNRVVVGAVAADVPGGLADTGAAYVFTSAGGAAWTQSQKLVASDASASDSFGGAVAIDGNRLIVGAPAAALGAGGAYVFEPAGGVWAQTAKLTTSTAAGDGLGGAVAVTGALALAGAPEEAVDPALTSAGAVHAFHESPPGGAWPAVYRLAASQSVAGDRFGYGSQLSLSADTLVTSGSDQVDILRRDAQTWSLTQQLAAPTGEEVDTVATNGDRLAVFETDINKLGTAFWHLSTYQRSTAGAWTFDQALPLDLVVLPMKNQAEAATSVGLALQGSRLVVGARRWSDGAGRVFIYDRSASTWALSQILESGEDAFDLNYGENVALDGDTVIVSEVPTKTQGIHPGVVHIFTRSNGSFSEAQAITAPMPIDADGFGNGLAFEGDLLAIFGESPSLGHRTLRVYRRTAGVFAETWSIDSTGVSLALDGDRLAVGVPTAGSGPLANSGEVRIYRRQPDDTWALDVSWQAWDAVSGQNLGTNIGFVDGHLVASAHASTGVGDVVYGTDL